MDLGSELRKELATLCGQPPSPPCGGKTTSPARCQFTISHRICILVGNGSTPLSAPGWAKSGGWTVLSILPASKSSKAISLLPSPLSSRRASFWTKSLREVIPDILSVAGITAERPRMFISYKRDETQGLANQLFHGLAEDGFDVFLDHFRIPAGAELMSRIRHELGDKTMVVVLESQHILSSSWTQYEIRVAQALRLGLFAIHVPGGTLISGIGAARRQITHPSDYIGGNFNAGSELTPKALTDVLGKIRTQHDRALVIRQHQVAASMENALLLQGIKVRRFDSSGRMHVSAKPPSKKNYVVWLASRSPGLSDFHLAASQLNAATNAVVVGIARAMESERFKEVAWLSSETRVRLCDEGNLTQTAARIASGTL